MRHICHKGTPPICFEYKTRRMYHSGTEICRAYATHLWKK